MTTARRGAALLATATLALAVAQPTTTAAAPADEPRMVLLLDSSGSMKEPAQGGMTKIEAARTALSSVIADLPVDTATGLRVFGASVENAGDPGACQDSQLVVPVGTDNRAALETAAANYRPYGETPIGHGLQEAAKDLGESGKRSIVLVSDGVATCEPDPCDVAEQLAGKGVDLAIHVVGLGVDATTRKQLQCIADKGKGTYHDAKDATQLAEALDRAQRTLLPPKMVDGKPVKGTRTIVGAPSIRVGDWIDDIGPDGSEDGVRFYRLRRTIPGSTLLATAIVHPNAEQQDAVMATLSAGETQCGVDTANGHPGGDQMMVSATAVADQRDEDCASATDLVLQVERKGVRKGTGTPPLQLVVSEVPPVTNLDQLPEAPARRTLPAPAFGPGTSVQPGGTLAAAAPIVGGATYEHVLAPGQMHTYKVPVGWGQSLSVQVQSPKPGPQLAKLFREQRMVLDAELFDPAGRKVAEHPIRLTQYGYSSKMQAADVTFNFPEGQPLKHPWVAGHYRVAIGVRGPADAPKVEVPYQFVTKVNGKVQGVPAYGTVAGVSPSPSASATAAPSGDSGSPAAVAGGSGSDQTSQDKAGSHTGTSDESHGISPWPVLLGVLGIILTACGVVLGLTRRRRNRPDAAPSGNGLPYQTEWKPGGDSSEHR